MATPYEAWLQMQSGMPGMAMPPSAPPPMPSYARSPYLTPQQSEMLGMPFPASPLGMELPGSSPYSAPPADLRSREPRVPPTAAPPAPLGGGFTPAMQTLPRQIERGRGPFDDFLATYNLGRTPAEASPFGPAPAPEAARPPLYAQPQQPMPGGYGGGGMDGGQMQREAMLARRFPRAMARVQQLRAMSQRRGY